MTEAEQPVQTESEAVLPADEPKPIDPTLTAEQKFIMLGESQVAIQTLKLTYKTNKTNSVKLRKELMATIKLAEDLRKSVLDSKKAIPTKPRTKKIVPESPQVVEVEA